MHRLKRTPLTPILTVSLACLWLSATPVAARTAPTAPAGAPAGTCGGWNVVKSPSPGPSSILNDVVALSPSNIWAVSHYHS